MFRRGNIGSIALAILMAEVVVFVLVVERIGFGSTLLLTLASSCFGLITLRRSGHLALAALHRLSEGSLTRQGAFLDGMLGAVGGSLLVVPGFVTDLIGLFLIAPSGRHWLTRHFGLPVESPATAGPAKASPQTIDLGENDWRRIDKQPSRGSSG